MTEQAKIINFIHGKLSNFLYKIGMVSLDYNEDNSIEFILEGYTVTISVEAKLDKSKKLRG